ncbi:MAG: ATP-binding cassette domain-containing protein [Acidiferrobacterales bacterium]|nr:ATP-binding cassette domain-containing protein [Acidiferrobacterales bacterium]
MKPGKPNLQLVDAENQANIESKEAASSLDHHRIIQVDGVNRIVDVAGEPLQILHEVDLRVSRGETVAIVGSSGSGKSTLLGLLAGLDLPSSGKIELAGEVISAMDEDARAAVRASNVGFVFQSFQLLPNLTAAENVALPLEILGKGEATALSAEILKRVGLEERQTHYPNQLSGGEQQRVAIARAFVTKPAVLFADEPTGNLDKNTGDLVADLLFELNAENNTTLVLVTHDSGLAARCDRQVGMESGRLSEKIAS